MFGLPTVGTSLAGHHGLQGLWASGVVAQRLRCSEACGIFVDQGSNPRPLHWQGGFFITEPPGKPLSIFLKTV